MSDLSPLLGEERKLDFGAARSAFDTHLRHWPRPTIMFSIPGFCPINAFTLAAKLPSPELGVGHAAPRFHNSYRRCGGDVAACRLGAEYQQSPQTDRLLSRSQSGTAGILACRHARPRLDRGAGLHRPPVRDRVGKSQPIK